MSIGELFEIVGQGANYMPYVMVWFLWKMERRIYTLELFIFHKTKGELK